MSALKLGFQKGRQAVLANVRNAAKCQHLSTRPLSSRKPTPARLASTCRTSAAQLPGLATSEEWEHVAEDIGIQQTNALEPGKSSGILEGFQRFWKGYNDLLEKRPVLTKSLTSFFGFLLGDILAQLITGEPYVIMRTVRMTLFGVLMDGPIGHLWYTTLDKLVMPDSPKSNAAVVAKMLLDQLTWAPAFTMVFFTFMCCLEGRPHMALACVKQKLWPVMLTNYTIWPLAHIVNFKFVPSSQRILYINFCQILWSCYLSMANAKAV